MLGLWQWQLHLDAPFFLFKLYKRLGYLRSHLCY